MKIEEIENGVKITIIKEDDKSKTKFEQTEDGLNFEFINEILPLIQNENLENQDTKLLKDSLIKKLTLNIGHLIDYRNEIELLKIILENEK